MRTVIIIHHQSIR